MSAGLYRDVTQSSLARAPSSIPTMAQLEDGTMKMRVTRPVDKETLLSSSVGVAWQASKSQVFGMPSSAVGLNTPKILELDVNRMMLGQTDVRCVHKFVNSTISPLTKTCEDIKRPVRKYFSVVFI